MVAVPVADLVPDLHRQAAVPRVGRHERLETLEHDQHVLVPVIPRKPEDHVHERHEVVLETNLRERRPVEGGNKLGRARQGREKW